MSKFRISNSFERYEIVDADGFMCTGDNWLSFSSIQEAELFLRPFLNKYENITALRNLLASTSGSEGIGFSPEDISKRVIVLLVEDRLRLRPYDPINDRWETSFGLPLGVWNETKPVKAKPEPEDIAETPTQKQEEWSWIKFNFVDDQSDLPVYGVRLSVKFPKGEEREISAGMRGNARFNDINSGKCELSSSAENVSLDNVMNFLAVGQKASAGQTGPADNKGEPKSPKMIHASRILQVESKKVKTGDTFKSLASSVGMSWNELAVFNWGTSKKKKVDHYLEHSVGCTKRSENGNTFVFDDADNPGIIYLPKAWSLGDLSTGEEHTLRLGSVLGCFNIRLDMDPDDPDQQDDVFRLFSTNGTFESKKTIKDDQIKGDDFLDLEFTDLDVRQSYSLEINPGSEGEPYLVFKDIPYFELNDIDLSGKTEEYTEEEEELDIDAILEQEPD